MGIEQLELLETTRVSITNFNHLLSHQNTRPVLVKYLCRITGLPQLTCYKYALDCYARMDYNDKVFKNEITEANLPEEAYA